jgi:hypothetical protein
MARPVRLHLSWRRNGDNFDVALAVNRLLAHNHPVWWCLKPAGTVEAGDYLLEGPSGLAERLSALNVSAVRWSGRLPPGAQRLEPPRVSLLAGQASAYPYFAYYALCLTRLGLSYDPVGGAEIAQRRLHGANLFVLPGGFATWGLDVAEESPGADAVVRAFLERGGACIGSCGGAYYLSAGRQGWTGTAWARPRYTHEYLQSGTGIVSLRLADHVLAVGCPPTMEVPYYHGPIYDDAGPGVDVAGVFHDLCLPGRLAIDNPLEAHRFKRELAGRPAILRAQGRRGRAILFSPHPEMGDLVRKYVALDGYVRRYLPIRGRRTMEETLRAYRPLDSPSFHLILNAAHALMIRPVGRSGGGAQNPAGVDRHPVRWLSGLRSFQETTGKLLASSRVPSSTAYGAVVRSVATQLAARLAPAADDLARALRRLSETRSPETRRLLNAWSHLASQATHTLTQGSRSSRPVAERLLHAELAICLWDAWRRLIEGELAIAPLRPLR